MCLQLDLKPSGRLLVQVRHFKDNEGEDGIHCGIPVMHSCQLLRKNLSCSGFENNKIKKYNLFSQIKLQNNSDCTICNLVLFYFRTPFRWDLTSLGPSPLFHAHSMNKYSGFRLFNVGRSACLFIYLYYSACCSSTTR